MMINAYSNNEEIEHVSVGEPPNATASVVPRIHMN
jgi:hypothetical protein